MQTLGLRRRRDHPEVEVLALRGSVAAAIGTKPALRLAFAVRLITVLAVLAAREIRGPAAIPPARPGALPATPRSECVR